TRCPTIHWPKFRSRNGCQAAVTLLISEWDTVLPLKLWVVRNLPQPLNAFEEVTMHKILVVLLFTSAPSFAADLSGVWKIDGTVGDNTVSVTCTFKQTDTHITG